MRIILLIALSAFAITVKAQDSTWTKDQEKVYGSKLEKHQQDVIAMQSNNRSLCRFIGFKEFYEQNINEYLQLRGFALDDWKNTAAFNSYILSKKGVYFGSKIPKVSVVMYHDKDHRITSGKITGSFIYMANLFLNYWPQDPVFNNAGTLKPGVAAIKHCYGDLITFRNNGSACTISITKDPNIVLAVK